MEAEVGGEVQRCAPNASLLLAKAVLRYGSSRRISSKGETTKRELATWLAHREPMGKRPPTGASIPNHSQTHSSLLRLCS